METLVNWVRKFLPWITATIVQVLVNIGCDVTARRAILSIDHEVVALRWLKLELGVGLG